MYSFEKSIFINRPQKEVFDFVTNPTNHTQWQITTESAEWTTDGPPRIGSTFKVVIKLGWRKIESEIEITDWDPYNMFGFKGSNGNLQATGKSRFEPKGNGTQVTLNAQIKGAGFLWLLEGLVGRQAEKQDCANYDALKLLLEAS